MKDRRSAIIITLAVLLVLSVLCVFLDLSWVSSSKSYSFIEVWEALTGRGSWGSSTIVIDINLVRVVIGIFVGAGLAVAGTAMQAVFRNPLASPYLLGLSSGASVGAALSMLFR